jgi:predicted permease
MLHDLLEDLRYGLRVLKSGPAATLAAVLTLSLGIAANTVVFGWTSGLLLNPFPGVENSANLAAIETLSPTGEYLTNSFRDYCEIRDSTSFASGMAASMMNAFNVGDDQQPARVWGEFVSANYFDVLQLAPAQGRLFKPADFGDQPTALRQVVISHHLWRTVFESDRNIVGRAIRVNRELMTVIAVAPEGFRGTVPGVQLEMWAPIVMAPQLSGQGVYLLEDRNQRQFWITARLKPGVSIPQANAELRTIAAGIARANPKTSLGFSAEAMPVWRAHIGAQGLLLKPLQILLAVAAVVFLIVIANVTNLQLARATARQKEFGIRLAMGAARQRLIRQLLTESLILSILGAAFGILLSLWLAPTLGWLMPPVNLPLGLAYRTDARVLLFTTLLTVFAAIFSGVAPALLASDSKVSSTLKDSASTSSGLRSHRIRSILVVAEVALAMVAILSTGLFGESFRRARSLDTGFHPERVVLAQIHLSTFCRTAQDRREFVLRLHDGLLSIPGVTHVSYSDSIPLALGNPATTTPRIEGYTPATGEDMRIATTNTGPNFLDSLGIPLLEGRGFTEADDKGSPPVAVVNQAFTRRYFPGVSTPLGRRVTSGGRTFTIVGLARDAKFANLIQPPGPMIYEPYRQTYGDQFWIAFFIRTDRAPASLVGAVRREIGRLNPHAGVAEIIPYAEFAGASLYPQKVAAILVTGLGVISLALAAIGLYGVLSFSVAQRRREFSIRSALGASGTRIGLLVLRHAAVLTISGILIGGVIAFLAIPRAAALLVEVNPADPLIFAGAVAFLCLISMVASLLPARSATTVDPISVLRQQ